MIEPVDQVSNGALKMPNIMEASTHHKMEELTKQIAETTALMKSRLEEIEALKTANANLTKRLVEHNGAIAAYENMLRVFAETKAKS